MVLLVFLNLSSQSPIFFYFNPLSKSIVLPNITIVVTIITIINSDVDYERTRYTTRKKIREVYILVIKSVTILQIIVETDVHYFDFVFV